MQDILIIVFIFIMLISIAVIGLVGLFMFKSLKLFKNRFDKED